MIDRRWSDGGAPARQNWLMTELIDVLRELSVGRRVAEEEADELAAYFVETDQFRRILQGEVDIVFGPKGAGKSAIYASLLSRAGDLFDRGVTLVAGELPRGAPAFNDIVADPPTSETEFTGMWKLYVLSLVNDVLEDYDINSPDARLVRDQLAAAGLVKPAGGLRGLVRRVREYVHRLLEAQEVEGGVKLDPATGMPVGVTGKIVLGEPSTEMRTSGIYSVDDLLAAADQALSAVDTSLWVLLDRLDVAFAESRELEANALRSLFRVYLDTLSLRRIRLKIFLRTDIWRAVTERGFREASHVTRTVTLSWRESALLNLLVRRLLNNPSLAEYTSASTTAVLADASQQRRWFDSLVPDQIDSGKNPRTFEWILGRVKDGQGVVAPREVIHVLDQARDRQLESLERGEAAPEEGMVFTRAAFRDALPEVSRVRLEQTLYAEYPDLKPYLEKLHSEKTNHSLESLAALWDIGLDEASSLATRAAEIGFFEVRGDKSDPDYWVPFLYRPALSMVQGTAEP
jgi:hypothetical protein